ncbi:MAG: beta-propeller domain-containing protein [Thermoproteota archaeon]
MYLCEDRLAVIVNNYSFPTELKPEEVYRMPCTPQAFVKVYDIEDRENPGLTRTVILNGILSGSRLIGEFIYAVINQQAVKTGGNQTDLEVVLPPISGDYTEVVQPTEIRYVDASDASYRFTTVVAVNILDEGQKPTYESFLAGQTSQLYISLNNMYLVVPQHPCLDST